LLILGIAAAAGAVPHWLRRPRVLIVVPVPLASAATWAAGVTGSQTAHWVGGLVLFFLKVGATLFGSGYVLVTYLHAGLVEGHGWLTDQQLLDAVAVGQVTPGPLLTTATFVGYVVGYRATGSEAAGVVGAVAATVAIFLPAFVFVALLGHLLPRVRELPAARGALDAANAAVAGLVLVVTLMLAHQALRDPLSIGIATAAFLVLVASNLNATWVMLAAAAIGLARGGLGG
jgi:chromate transporter